VDKEGLAEKLRAFNLSPKQAKIYAYLCEFNKASAKDISEATLIYTQDVYATVKELEKKELVLKNKTSPITVEAIPLEKALQTLIGSIESKYKEDVKTLKKCCKEILIQNKKVQKDIESPSARTVIVFENEPPESRVNMAFDSLKEEYDCAIAEDFLDYHKLGVDFGKLTLEKLAKKRIKVKFLFVGSEESNLARVEDAKKNMPKNGFVKIRTLKVRDFTHTPSYALMDSRELWLRVPSIGKEYATILTDVKEMVEMAKFQFEALWNDPNAKSIVQGRLNRKELVQAIT
jgi:sugar-specific transcriptional regulator TrmB